MQKKIEKLKKKVFLKKKKKKEKRKKLAKKKTLWITVIIHSNLGMGEQ